MSDRDVIMALLRRIDQLERRVAQLERVETGVIRYAEADTDAAPTNAQLDSAFGDATTALFNGFVGVIFDTAGIGATATLAVVANDTWYYESLSVAT